MEIRWVFYFFEIFVHFSVDLIFLSLFQYFYLIKWEGFSHDKNTWERTKNINKKLIADFHRKLEEQRREVIESNADIIRAVRCEDIRRGENQNEYLIKYNDLKKKWIRSDELSVSETHCVLIFFEKIIEFE